MDIIVQKYGGTSVASKEKLEQIVRNILKRCKEKKSIIVVVSAQGKTTDNLVKVAGDYVSNKYPKEMDILLSTGELQTVALLTMMLKEKGIEAVGLNGEQAGIITDSNYSNAKILTIIPDNILKCLKEDKVAVVAGFQGIDKFGNTTTLGRGGSDLSAVAIASSLKAKVCEIYTDVEGVYSGDPKIIRRAKLLKNISYEEMLEASNAGAKVLHNRSVAVAKKYDTKIVVRHFATSTGGTFVKDVDKRMENYGPKLITIKSELSKITIVGENLSDNIECIDEIKKITSEQGVKIYMITICDNSINIIIESKVAEELVNILHDKLILKSDKL